LQNTLKSRGTIVLISCSRNAMTQPKMMQMKKLQMIL